MVFRKLQKRYGGHCEETFCCKLSQPKEPTPGDDDDDAGGDGDGGDDVDQFAGERVEDRVELGLVFIGDPPLRQKQWDGFSQPDW